VSVLLLTRKERRWATALVKEYVSGPEVGGVEK
jgi:hypothetical protein